MFITKKHISRRAVLRIVELSNRLPEPSYRIVVLIPHFDNGFWKISG